MQKRNQIDVVFGIGEKGSIQFVQPLTPINLWLEKEIAPKYHYFEGHTLIIYRFPSLWMRKSFI